MRIFDFLKNDKPSAKNKAYIITDCLPPEIDIDTSLIDLNIPSIRDQLVLLLIARTRLNNPRNLGLQLDRCDFPGNEGKSVANLVDDQLVYFSQINGFGHPVIYTVTKLGEHFIRNRLVHDEITQHIKQMNNPDFMIELVQALFSKMKSE